MLLDEYGKPIRDAREWLEDPAYSKYDARVDPVMEALFDYAVALEESNKKLVKTCRQFVRGWEHADKVEMLDGVKLARAALKEAGFS